MRLTTIFAAEWQVVARIDTLGRCRVREAMDALERTDKDAHDQLIAVLDRVSRHGPRRDPRQSRHLGGAIYELKTAKGWRLFYFFDHGRILVCTELCRKPKARELRELIRGAQRERREYLAARAADAILMEDHP
jgi:phage-related protein